MRKAIYILLIFLSLPLFGQAKKKTVYFVVEFSCMEINGKEYHGTPEHGRYKSDAKITYEFNGPIVLSCLDDPKIYAKAKKATIRHWENGNWHTQNVMGKIKKGIKKSSRIKTKKQETRK